MNIFSTLIFNMILLTSCFLRAQEKKLYVLNQVTKQPVKFPIIVYPNGLGKYADVNGHLEIREEIDSINISCIGFNSSYLSPVQAIDTVYLKPTTPTITTYSLEELLIHSSSIKKRKYTLHGFKKSSNLRINLPQGSEVGCFIPNSISEKLIIGSIMTWVKTDLNSESYLRVHLYNAIDGYPGKEILIPNNFYKILKSGKIEINFSEFAIPFPRRGLFISIESIDTGEYVTPTEFYLTKKYTKSDTYIKGSYFNHDWKKIEDSGLMQLLPDAESLNIAIQVKIVPAD